MGIRTKLALAAGMAAAISTSAQAATVADLGLSLEQIRSLNAQLTAPIAAPGIAFGSPVGYGASWGQLFAGVGGQTIPPGNEYDVDGSMLVGFGVGDPDRYAGLELSSTIISLRNDFGEDGNYNAKLHRSLPWRASVAVGVEGAEGWGDATDAQESVYGVYTQSFELMPNSPRHPLPLILNVGVGDERFVDPGEDGVGAFGSLAIHPHRQLSVIADYTGRDTNAALSFVPFRRMPLVVTLGAINLGERLGNDVEFAGGVGYLYQF